MNEHGHLRFRGDLAFVRPCVPLLHVFDNERPRACVRREVDGQAVISDESVAVHCQDVGVPLPHPRNLCCGEREKDGDEKGALWRVCVKLPRWGKVCGEKVGFVTSS